MTTDPDRNCDRRRTSYPAREKGAATQQRLSKEDEENCNKQTKKGKEMRGRRVLSTKLTTRGNHQKSNMRADERLFRLEELLDIG